MTASSAPTVASRGVRAVIALVVALGVITAVAAVLVASSTAPDAASVQIEGTAAEWDVVLVVDSPTVGVRRAEIVVTDSDGSAVADAVVTMNATMQSMGHSGVVATGVQSTAGHYELAGDLFPMSGRWAVTVAIEYGGTTSTATLPIVITRS